MESPEKVAMRGKALAFKKLIVPENSPLALMERFPFLMGLFPTLMGHFVPPYGVDPPLWQMVT